MKFKRIIEVFETIGREPRPYTIEDGQRCLSIVCDNPIQVMLDVFEMESDAAEMIYSSTKEALNGIWDICQVLRHSEQKTIDSGLTLVYWPYIDWRNETVAENSEVVVPYNV